MPDEVISAPAPLSRSAMVSASRERVGFEDRLYSYPADSPGFVHAYVVDR
jgi:hypothetical protein